jgi:beta-fructofuranosidase
VIGSGVAGVGGTALHYRSRDFYDWLFVDSLVPLDKLGQGIDRGTIGWECPDFFEIDGQHVLIAAMWDEEPVSVAYFVGDYADQRFTPRHEGIVDPGVSFYAPQSFTDDSGRRIMFGWVKESRSAEAQRNAGWSGVMTLPRVLSVLEDGSLGSAPAPEVERLRGHHVRLSGDQVIDGEPLQLQDIPGNSLELLVSFRPGFSGTFRIDVLCSADGRECTTISLDAESGTLTLDTRQSSTSETVEGGMYSLRRRGGANGPDHLRIFVDHSLIELFLNDEQCITARAYPDIADATGVRLSAAHAVASIDAWQMGSNWVA